MDTVEKLVFTADASSMIQTMKNMHRSFGELGGDSKKFSDAITNVSRTLSKAENYLGSWMQSTSRAPAIVKKSTTSIANDYTDMAREIRQATGSSILEIQRLQGIITPEPKSPLSLSPEAIAANQSRISQGDAAWKQRIFTSGQGSPATVVKQLAAETAKADVAARGLTFTWRTCIRIFESFIIYRGIYAIGNAIKYAATSAAEFQIKISQIRTISQDNQLAFGQWAQAVRNLSNEFGTPLIDTAAGAYEVLSNQVAKGAKAISFMREANKLSLVTFASSQDSVSALTGIINAYGLDTSDAAEISAKLFKTIELGRVYMVDLAGSIGDVSSIASLLGISLDELLAAISSITIRSVNPRNALTQLRNIFSQLLKPSEDMKDALHSIGYESGPDLIRVNQLSGALEKLVGVRPDLEGLADIFRNIRGFAGAAILSRDSEGFKKNVSEMKNASESFNAAVVISTESAGKQLQIEVNKIKNYFTVDLGSRLLEIFASISQQLGGFDVVVKTVADSLRTLLIPALILAGIQLFKLGTILTSHPYIVAAAALVAAIAAIRAAIVAEALIEEKLLGASIRRWDDYATRVIADMRRISNERLEDAKNLALNVSQQAAAVIAGINAQQDAAAKSAKDVHASASEALRDTLEAVRDSIHKLNSELNTAEANVKRIDNALQDLKNSRQEESVDTKLNDATPSDKVLILQDEIKRLFGQGQKSSTFEDVEFSFKKALDYAKDIRKITDDYEKEQAKVQKEIAKAHDEYERTDTRLRKQQDKGKIGTRSQIKQQRDELKASYLQTVRELQDSLAGQGTLSVTTKDVDRAINNIVKKHTEALKKLRTNESTEVAKVIKDQAELELREKAITRAQRLSKEQDVNKILAEKELDDIKKVFSERQALFNQQAEQLERSKSLVTDADKRFEIEEAIGAIRKQQREEQLALEGEIEKRRVVGKEKELTDKTTLFSERFKALQIESEQSQKNLQKLLRQRELGEARFRILAEGQGAGRNVDAFLQGKLKSPADVAGYEEMRRQAFQEVQVMSPERIQAEIDAAVTRNEAVQKSFNDFLLKLPEPLRNVLTAVESVSMAFQTKIDDAQGAFDAYVIALAELTRATGAAAARLNPAPVNPVPGRAFGGMVSRGTDSILALLSPGEYVMNANASRKYYSQLVAMNSSIPGFASGGPVTNVNGDFNISLQSSGNSSADVQEIGRLLRREIRRGTVSLT
jgi:TP901 family phage tail tape measure protein